MFGLSFSNEFFYGDGTEDYYSMPPSERPTNVHQALVSLDEETRREIARDVLGYEGSVLEFAIKSEMFESDVMEKIKETDACDTLSAPIRVYIDSEHNFSVTVYEEVRNED
jgi:hypothetical protein